MGTSLTSQGCVGTKNELLPFVSYEQAPAHLSHSLPALLFGKPEGQVIPGPRLLSSHPCLHIVSPLPEKLFSLSSALLSFTQDPDQTSHLLQEACGPPGWAGVSGASAALMCSCLSQVAVAVSSLRAGAPVWSQAGPTYQLGSSAKHSPSSAVTTLPGLTNWHLERLLCWKVTPGLLQGKAQHPGAILDPSLGLVPAAGAHEESSGSPSREPQERQPCSALPQPEEATK